jgi:glutamyl-tRNA reductase
MKLFAAGISHKTAPVELREQLAVKQSAIVDLAFVLKCFGHLDEIVLLSTCNRIEIYGTTPQATAHIKSLLKRSSSRCLRTVSARRGNMTPAIRFIPSYQHIWDPIAARVSQHENGADVFLARMTVAI